MTGSHDATGPREETGRKQVVKAVGAAGSVLGAVSAATALVQNSERLLQSIAYLLGGAAVVALVALLVIHRNATLAVPLWGASLFVSLLLALGFVLAWLDSDRGGDRAEAGPTSGPSSAPVVPTTTTPSTPPTSPPTSPAASSCAALATTATVQPDLDDATPGPRLVAASYTLEPADKLLLTWSGRVEGRPAAGEDLYLAGNADPTTLDSSKPPRAGTSNYFLLRKLDLDGQGCWTVPRRSVGYDCAGGITFVYHLVSVARDKGDELVAQQRRNPVLADDGYRRTTFEAAPVTLRQKFEVPTPADPACQ